jgi:hypothetical protein
MHNPDAQSKLDGRLVACSAYGKLVLADPYGVRYEEVLYVDPNKSMLIHSENLLRPTAVSGG